MQFGEALDAGQLLLDLGRFQAQNLHVFAIYADHDGVAGTG